MSAAPRRRAPQRRGQWLFLGTLVVFWGLLAASGMDRFKRPEPTRIAYTISQEDMEGLTGLRMEGAEDGEERGRGVEVVIDAASVVRIALKSRDHGDYLDGHDLEPPEGGQPRMVAYREGDTLVLRWADVPSGRQPARGIKQMVWVDKIVLPVQFQHLALANSRVDVRVPMKRLAVAGQEVTVQGDMQHLDLWSTQCRPCQAGALPQPADAAAAQCEQLRARYPDKLSVTGGLVRSLRVNARSGKLMLDGSANLVTADLQLGSAVSLSLDRADLLHRLRAAGDMPGMPAPDACPAGAAAPSRPVVLLPTAS